MSTALINTVKDLYLTYSYTQKNNNNSTASYHCYCTKAVLQQRPANNTSIFSSTTFQGGNELWTVILISQNKYLRVAVGAARATPVTNPPALFLLSDFDFHFRRPTQSQCRLTAYTSFQNSQLSLRNSASARPGTVSSWVSPVWATMASKPSSSRQRLYHMLKPLPRSWTTLCQRWHTLAAQARLWPSSLLRMKQSSSEGKRSIADADAICLPACFFFLLPIWLLQNSSGFHSSSLSYTSEEEKKHESNVFFKHNP